MVKCSKEASSVFFFPSVNQILYLLAIFNYNVQPMSEKTGLTTDYTNLVIYLSFNNIGDLKCKRFKESYKLMEFCFMIKLYGDSFKYR